LEDPDAEEKVKVECPRCSGSGRMRKAGDADARKLMAETVGWTKRGGGAGPSVNLNLNLGGVESVIEEVERASTSSPRKIASAGGAIVDVTPDEVDESGGGGK